MMAHSASEGWVIATETWAILCVLYLLVAGTRSLQSHQRKQVTFQTAGFTLWDGSSRCFTRLRTSLKTRHQTHFVEDKKAPDGYFRRRGEARRRSTAPERKAFGRYNCFFFYTVYC